MTDEELLEFWLNTLIRYCASDVPSSSIYRVRGKIKDIAQRIKNKEITKHEETKNPSIGIDYSAFDLLYIQLLKIKFPCGCSISGRCDACYSIRPKI